MQRNLAFCAACLGAALFPGPAFAYIDPGIAGVLYQLIYMAIFGAVTAWVIRPWRYIRGAFKRKQAGQKRPAETSPSPAVDER